MRMNLVIIARLHIIRQGIMQKLKPLGYTIYTFEDVQDFLPRFNNINPDVIIMDGDGEGNKWKFLLLGLKKSKKKIFFILMANKMSIDAANEAITLGVSGIILKPFNPKQHIRKISEIILTRKSIQLKREYPRIYLPTDEKPTLKYFDPQKQDIISFTIINISTRGAMLRLLYPEYNSIFQSGYRVPEAKLNTGSLESSISFMVVHNQGEYIGILFEEIHTNKPQLYKYIELQYTNIFGTPRIKGKW